jgi:hypothetical protein
MSRTLKKILITVGVAFIVTLVEGYIPARTAVSSFGPIHLSTHDISSDGQFQCFAIVNPVVFTRHTNYGQGLPFIYKTTSSDCLHHYVTVAFMGFIADWLVVAVVLIILWFVIERFRHRTTLHTPRM